MEDFKYTAVMTLNFDHDLSKVTSDINHYKIPTSRSLLFSFLFPLMFTNWS